MMPRTDSQSGHGVQAPPPRLAEDSKPLAAGRPSPGEVGQGPIAGQAFTGKQLQPAPSPAPSAHQPSKPARFPTPRTDPRAKLLWLSSLSTLPPPQRLTRICDLLSTALVRDWASRATLATAFPPPTPRSPLAPGAPTEARIVAYLGLIPQAGMSDLRETLGLPKMQAYRATVALIAAGRVIATGRSHQTKYALSPAEAAKAERN